MTTTECTRLARVLAPALLPSRHWARHARSFLLASLVTVAGAAMPAIAATYAYVDWTSANVAQGTASGTIALPDGSTIAVSFAATGTDGAPVPLVGVQTAGGTNYWMPASTYTSTEVGNAPLTPDIIQLGSGPDQTYVITLSKDVKSPILSLVSLGGPGNPVTYQFSLFAAFDLLSQGPGYRGSGSLTATSNTALRGEEGNGTIQFRGTLSTIGWRVSTQEAWHGFTLGVRTDEVGPAVNPPTAQTNPATTITATGATLNATVNSNGAATTVTFEFGTSASYGSSAPAAQNPLAAGATGAAASATIGGLACGTTYHFRAVVVNTAGTTTSPDATFATAACAGSNGVAPLTGIVKAAIQSDHACAVTAAGRLMCWGNNSGGQLGDGTFVERVTPVEVAGLGSGVAAVAVGYGHTCALTTAGGVKCWGTNYAGQLGDGTMTDRSMPVDVVGLSSGVTAVAAGWTHTCAIAAGGALKCWGGGSDGKLGDGATTNRLTPVGVTGLAAGVTAVAAGANHTCAVAAGGGAKCWGQNDDGQLGGGTYTYTPQATPIDVVGAGSGVAAVAVGFGYSCLLTASGAVRCWGINANSALGSGTAIERSSVPVNVVGLGSGVAAIAAGDSHACALTAGGAMTCWGDNADGQLGNGGQTVGATPATVPGLGSGVAAIAAGGRSSCAITGGGALKCWGADDEAQLGDGSDPHRSTPVDVAGLTSGVSAIAAGNFHNCAVTTGGGVKCWGWNMSGQLGDGTMTDRTAPAQVLGLETGAAGVSAGATHSCAVAAGGALKCWGSNSSGELGDGTTTTSTTPVPVAGLSSGVVSVAAGASHTCALTSGGAVKCWGDNGSGQLGDGTTTQRSAPVPVTGLGSGIVAIAVGDAHSCALTGGGAMKCWGYNSRGELGDGTTTNPRKQPVDIVGLASGVAAIATGMVHSCARTTAGSLKCWGKNDAGQLGDGTTTDRTVPADVKGLAAGVGKVAGGLRHTCAIASGGALKCWGSNDKGQLGDGTTYSRNVAGGVSGLAGGVTAVAASVAHTCAIAGSGAVKCWGSRGGGGVLGDGTGELRRGVPANVVVAVPDRLAVVQLNDGLPITVGVPFSARVEARNATSAGPVQAATALGLALTSGTGPLGGTATCTIPAGGHTCVVTGLTLDASQAGAVLSAHRTSGDNLGDGSSLAFAVFSSPTNAALAGLALSAGTLAPAFAPATTAYTAAVATGVAAVTLTPTASDPAATIRVNGTPVASGSASAPLALAPGANTLTVVVTATDGTTTRTYTVTVTRASVTVPGAPTAVTATAGNAQASVSFTPPASNGGSPITGYTVASTPAGGTDTAAGSTATTHTITGLANGVAYTFTVTATNAAGPGAPSAPSNSVTPAAPPPVGVDGNFQGLWWAAPAHSESGWGINFSHQGDIIFATWFTYDAAGKPWWLIAELHRTAPGTYAGPVSSVAGPLFNSSPFGPTPVETVIGTMTVTFVDGKHGSLAYTVNGTTRTKAIVPQEFGPLPTCSWGSQPDLALATNYTDLWWNAAESGWGINFTHQGDIIFATWFTYDTAGKPWWLIAELDKKSAGVYAGTVSTVTGQPFYSQPWDVNKIIETPVGTATVAFSDGNAAIFTYAVNGESRSKTITRQVFVAPGTVCQSPGDPVNVKVTTQSPNASTVTVTQEGTLKGLGFTFPGTAPAGLSVWSVPPAIAPEIPAEVTRLSDFFRVSPVVLADGMVTLTLPAALVPPGRLAQDLRLYVYSDAAQNVLPGTSISGPSWLRTWYDLDVLPNGDATIKLGGVGDLSFIGIEAPVAAVTSTPKTTIVMTRRGPVSVTTACQAKPLTIGAHDATQQVCGVEYAAGKKFVVTVKNMGDLHTTPFTTMDELLGWLGAARSYFDFYGLLSDGTFEVEIGPMKDARWLGFVTTENLEDRRVLHITKAPFQKDLIQGTAGHEYFHHAQSRTRAAGKTNLIDGSEGDWLIEGLARWFEDDLFDSLDAYVLEENQPFVRILEVGLDGFGGGDNDSRGRTYKRFAFWKMVQSKCPGFSIPQLLNVAVTDRSHGVLNLQGLIESDHWGCDFGGGLGDANKATLANALLAYSFATIKNDDISLLDSNEPYFKFQSEDGLLHVAPPCTPGGGCADSRFVRALSPAGALAFVVDEDPSPPEGMIPTLKFHALNGVDAFLWVGEAKQAMSSPSSGKWTDTAGGATIQ